LLARIESVVRRSSSHAPEDNVIEAGPLVFDREYLRVYLNGEDVQLTAKELAILDLLMNHPGKLFSRERILHNVWGINMDPTTNIVDVYIGKLRKKIDLEGDESLIETVRGLGYRLNLPPGTRKRSAKKVS
jgi:DNA-binding response OmpR family regulator